MRYAAHRKRTGKTVLAPEPTGEIVVRHCHGLAEFASCIEVERAVWRSSDVDVVPLPLFVIASEIGGQVLGAFDGERIVGFTLSFPGVRGSRPFLHSHMTGVLAPYWNRGIARRLKLFQREDALARKIERIEWTFDPLQLKNARFNLLRLGAIVRRYLPNLYGTTTSPLHSGLPTDRLLAEWPLRSVRVRRAISPHQERAGTVPVRGGASVLIRVPAGIEELARNKPDDAIRIQAEIRQEFEHWLGLGYAATAVESDADGSAYVLQPWPKDKA